jgi:hypothetical protein
MRTSGVRAIGTNRCVTEDQRNTTHGSPIDGGLSRVALWLTFERVVQPWTAASVRHRVGGGVGVQAPAPGTTRSARAVMARRSAWS